MTKNEALKMAIEAMKNLSESLIEKQIWFSSDIDDAIQACKEALEQPAQEPYRCHWVEKGKGHCERNKRMGFADDYGQPAPSWQGLSDDEIEQVYADTEPDSRLDTYYMDLSRAIEAKLKEKNS